MLFKHLHNQKGITLLESIIGFVIVAIILISFIGILQQTKKTTVSAEHTINATYIGQETLENIYALSKSIKFLDLADDFFILDPNYQIIHSTNKELQIKYSPSHPEFTVEITIKQNEALSSSLNLFNVIVSVSENGVLKNVVESVYTFK